MVSWEAVIRTVNNCEQSAVSYQLKITKRFLRMKNIVNFINSFTVDFVKIMKKYPVLLLFNLLICVNIVKLNRL